MKRPLKDLLSLDPEENYSPEPEEVVSSPTEAGTPPSNQNYNEQGLCIECGDQPSEVNCITCVEDFCQVCCDYIHRTGSRRSHQFKELEKQDQNGQEVQDVDMEGSDDTAIEEEEEEELTENAENISQIANSLIEVRGESGGDEATMLKRIKEHCRFIPLRLTHEERKLLRLLEAALNVSEYTERVDIISYTSKSKRMVAQLKEMCSILAGLVVATDMKMGQSLFEDKEFASNAEWFKKVFEIGRRYKIMNPEKMRDSFGKLMYMVMDSRLPEVKEAMEFDLYRPIKTVYSFLEHHGGEDTVAMLEDPRILDAVAEIFPEGKNRVRIQNEIRRKEKAIEELARAYSKKSPEIQAEDIRQCLYSIGDYHAYLRANRMPIERILAMLERNFDPDDAAGEFTLAISYGRSGARLSHDHQKQFHYAKQSLHLWSQIIRDMYMLWILADHDLTSIDAKNRYQFGDTGQGFNRIKACPHVSRAMHGIIRKVQQRNNGWIGSSVVHLGDRAVPNALFFLDKYLQVPRILTPVYLAISGIDSISTRNKHVERWVESQFGSVERLKKTVLSDFFKHAFDGSGADNFYDAGSCIDGRLTSAWNWANCISKKPYYYQFLVTGFTGFNGTDGW
ncbi:hypothetical protein TRVA0_021S00694 [Trichomonascus vanleenenianus]|uniref:uncharacterized protein n=1 Tax=Trichomonascus vanleenenianus TaxID=2268995 RepID=UPI003ECABD8B